MVVHIFERPSHSHLLSRKRTNEQIIPQLKVTVYLVLLGYLKVLVCLTSEYLSKRTFRKKYSQCFSSLIQVSSQIVSLNTLL